MTCSCLLLVVLLFQYCKQLYDDNCPVCLRQVNHHESHLYCQAVLVMIITFREGNCLNSTDEHRESNIWPWTLYLFCQQSWNNVMNCALFTSARILVKPIQVELTRWRNNVDRQAKMFDRKMTIVHCFSSHINLLLSHVNIFKTNENTKKGVCVHHWTTTEWKEKENTD